MESIRPILRRIDHAAIYLKIVGTYTPLVVMIGSSLAYIVLVVVWALAKVGMTLNLVFWRAPGSFNPLLYLARSGAHLQLSGGCSTRLV